MKLIKPKFEIIEQQPSIEGIYKMIEQAGRTCYKSEDKITEDSAKAFVDRMIKSGHGAMLEHGTVYLMKESEFINTHIHPEEGEEQECNPLLKYYDNAYSHVRQEHTTGWFVYVTTNLRVLVENGWMDDLQYACEPTEFHEKRITVRFILSRSIAQEYTRHRVFSYSMESQRYCNYSTDKFNNEVTFIIPCWLGWDEQNIHYGDFEKSGSGSIDSGLFINSLLDAEDYYLCLLKEGWKPQQAREVLPNACKTELIMTGFTDDWWGEYLVIDKSTGLVDQRIYGKFYTKLNSIDRDKYRIVEKGFFPLRCSSGAHPSAQELAFPLREEFVKREFIH